MMLNTADIPNLYENEERLEIIEKVGTDINEPDLWYTVLFYFNQNSPMFACYVQILIQ